MIDLGKRFDGVIYATKCGTITLCPSMKGF